MGLFNKYNYKKLFKISTEGDFYNSFEVKSEEEAKKVVEIANKNLTYLAALRKEIIEDPDWPKVMDRFQAGVRLPENYQKYFQLGYLKWESRNGGLFFLMDLENDLYWIDMDEDLGRGRFKWGWQWNKWYDREKKIYESEEDWPYSEIVSPNKYFNDLINNREKLDWIDFPVDFNYEWFYRNLKSKGGDSDVFSWVNTYMNFEGHKMIFRDLKWDSDVEEDIYSK